jgi:MFS family permease
VPSRAARSGTGRAACLRADGRLGGGPTGPAHPLDLLDATITTIAAPTISSSLHGGPGLITWLGASYALALGVLLVTGGRLGDKCALAGGPAHAMTLSLLTVIAIGVLSCLAIPLLPRHAQPAGPH